MWSSSFVSYLWGIETWSMASRWCRRYRVCILPMRYWNLEYLFSVVCMGWVCILPMRYWNLEQLAELNSNVLAFVSYLWGIETRDRWRGRWFHIRQFVSYLWGIETVFSRFQETGWVCWVCILPMRYWNRFFYMTMKGTLCCLYLTYEVLKLLIFFRPTGEFQSGLYLTYEVLKPMWGHRV